MLKVEGENRIDIESYVNRLAEHYQVPKKLALKWLCTALRYSIVREFIADEIDYLLEHGEIKRVVNTFLQQIDCFKGHSIIIAATNFEQSLDYAIWRRFDDTVRFNLPTDDEKRKIFSMRFRQFNGPLQAFDALLSSTNEFSHADVDNICKTIMRKCILEGKHVYTRRDVEWAVERQKRIVSLRKSQY